MRTQGLRRLLGVSATGILLGITGCSTTGGKEARTAGEAPRAELMLLNVPEASGWVAYARDAGSSSETEDYRIVVVRERDGEIIYDSLVPLSANLQTHGFEMDPEDPRLKNLSRQMEQDIIVPLIRHQRGSALPTPPQPVSPSPNVLEGVEVLEASEQSLVLNQGDRDVLREGVRIFVRTPAEYFTNPATGERVLLTRGEIVGLLSVTAVDGARATATLLSGVLPGEGYLELAPPEEE